MLSKKKSNKKKVPSKKKVPLGDNKKKSVSKKKLPSSNKTDTNKKVSKKNISDESISKLDNLVKKVEKLVKKVENPIYNNQLPTYIKPDDQPNNLDEKIMKPKQHIKNIDVQPNNLDEKIMKPKQQIKNIDLLDKYGYDIYNDDDKRHESLGNLVIIYGVSDLLKKLDSESSKTPNLSNKFNIDKKWVKDNFTK
jgi:hypothetical protein